MILSKLMEPEFPKREECLSEFHVNGAGNLERLAIGQVAVFAMLGCGRFSTPIDCRLYLPKIWTDDKKRCLKAKIPTDKIVFQTKHEQALEMVFHARKNGIYFNWVGFVGFY
jgi:SRSO17 transposase